MRIHPLFLLVVVVLAILVFMAAVCPFPRKIVYHKSRIAEIQIMEFEQALEAFKYYNKRYPTSAEGLDALVNSPGNLKDWKGPYLKKNVPDDPWGRAYVYRCPGIRNPGSYDLWSNGPDGIEGTEDDITNCK
jgi:general secretion pathway protein G